MTTSSEATRVCKVCQTERPISEFREYVKHGRTYWTYTCIECDNERRRLRYLKSTGNHEAIDMSSEAVQRRKWSVDNLRTDESGRCLYYWEYED